MFYIEFQNLIYLSEFKPILHLIICSYKGFLLRSRCVEKMHRILKTRCPKTYFHYLLEHGIYIVCENNVAIKYVQYCVKKRLKLSSCFHDICELNQRDFINADNLIENNYFYGVYKIKNAVFLPRTIITYKTLHIGIRGLQ